eukprot:jgi/Chlat1/4234/Chrsp27S04309
MEDGGGVRGLEAGGGESFAAAAATVLGMERGAFRELCCGQLKLGAAAESLAWRLAVAVESLLPKDAPPGLSWPYLLSLWRACCVFTAKGALSPAGGGNGGVPLADLLRAYQVTVVDFLRELRSFLLRAEPALNATLGDSPPLDQRLQVTELQTTFMLEALLANKYTKWYNSMFEATGGANATTSANATRSACVRFGWHLFALAKARLLPPHPDLAQSFFLLLAVMDVVLLHVPAQFRKFNTFCDATVFAGVAVNGKQPGASERLDTLTWLTSKFHASHGQVQVLSTQLQGLIESVLIGVKRCIPGEAAQLKEQVVCWASLMEPPMLFANLAAIDRECDRVLHEGGGELDARAFVAEDSAASVGNTAMLTPVRPGHVTNRRLSTSNGCWPGASPPRTPPPSMGGLPGTMSAVMRTPLSQVLASTLWMRTTVAQLPDSPNEVLLSFFNKCNGKSVADSIANRVRKLAAAVFPTESALRHRLEAICLYYHVLEGVLKAEQERLGPAGDLTPLLTKDAFHAALLACASEVVAAAYQMASPQFPITCDRAGIKPFDMCKVIQDFVRHADSMPRDIKKHLNAVEERVLESAGWERGSPLYDALARIASTATATTTSTGALSIIISDDVTFGQDSPTSPVAQQRQSAFQLFTSPIRTTNSTPIRPPPRALPPLPLAFAGNPDVLDTSKETPSERVVRTFFRKVLKLAAMRISDLCERLRLDSRVRQQVYDSIRHALWKKTSLFYNRHLDQLVVSAIYGVCKVNQLPIKFHQIVAHYRRQPQCKQEVIRSVVLEQSLPELVVAKRGDIIEYYNKVFVPEMKPFLQTLTPVIPVQQGLENEPISPVRQCPSESIAASYSPFPADVRSPKKVPHHNVYISPLRAPRADTPQESPARKLRAMLGQSINAYHSPSEDLQAINGLINRVRSTRQLDFSSVPSMPPPPSIQPQSSVPAVPVHAASNGRSSTSPLHKRIRTESNAISR